MGGKTEIYNARTLKVIYRACTVLGIIALIYNLVLCMGYGSRPPLYNGLVAQSVGVAFLLAGIFIPILKPRTRPQVITMCVGIYVIATLNLLFAVGNAPVTYLFWLMMLIATYMLHGIKPMLACCAYMVALLTFLFFFDTANPDLHALSSIGSAAILTICTACFIAWLNSINLIRLDAYEQLKSRERMQRDRLLTTVNNISDAIISTTPRGIIKLYNSATMSLIDTNATLNGKRIDSVLNLVDEDDKPVNITDIMSTRRTIERDDLSHVFEDGQKVNLYIACSPVRSSYGNTNNPENNGMIIVLRDITKIKSLDEERDEFISVVSHELRTPVTIAEGSISNLRTLAERGMVKSGTFDQALQSAHEQILFLAKMVNDLSTLSRAEQGAGKEAEIMDIRELATSMLEAHQEDAAKKGLRMDIDIKNVNGKIKASRLYVEEILQNFITNAIKYTDEGSVTIRASVSSGKVTFAVSDTGIGISRTDQKRIFDKFYRSEDYRTRESSGTGLGLYVASKLAKLLNTHIYFDSKLNHGSTFSFNLPLYKAKQSGDQK